MRTTLEIDDDVMAAARSLARQRHETIGRVVSDLARLSLLHRPKVTTRTGVPLLPVKDGSQLITMEMVNELRDGDKEG
ncbi:MAG: CopG family transcriptional regulator [Pseudomonadota bacterium]|nr:CopG family transcriptional regulator [Pseudomonadota bacterium]